MDDWSDMSLAAQRRAYRRIAQAHAILAHEMTCHPDDLVMIVTSRGGVVQLETVELEPPRARRLIKAKVARRRATEEG